MLACFLESYWQVVTWRLMKTRPLCYSSWHMDIQQASVCMSVCVCPPQCLKRIMYFTVPRLFLTRWPGMHADPSDLADTSLALGDCFWCFDLSFFKGYFTLNSMAKQFQKNCSGTACSTCLLFLFPLSALRSTRQLQASLGAKMQTVLMHNIYHCGRSTCLPGLIGPRAINQSSRRTLIQEWPEIRSVRYHLARSAFVQPCDILLSL